MQVKKQEGFVNPLFVVAIILVLAAGGFTYWRITQEKVDNSQTTEQTVTQQKLTPEETVSDITPTQAELDEHYSGYLPQFEYERDEVFNGCVAEASKEQDMSSTEASSLCRCAFVKGEEEYGIVKFVDFTRNGGYDQTFVEWSQRTFEDCQDEILG